MGARRRAMTVRDIRYQQPRVLTMWEVSKKSDVVGSVIFCAIGLAAMFMAINLDLGKITAPGPGFFPFLGAVLLTSVSILLLVAALSGRSTGSSAFADVWKRPAVMFVGSLVYVAIMNFTGFTVATFFLAMLVLRVLEKRNWWLDVAVSLVLAVGAHGLFSTLLEVPLPKGMLVRLLLG
jgi:putative tricarboxylic transport membrane protein